MLAQVILENITDNPHKALETVISECFMEFQPAVDIYQWYGMSEKIHDKKFDDFGVVASEYLQSISNQFLMLLKDTQETHLQIKFGIPYNPITKSMFTASALCHLMVAQQENKYTDPRWVLESEIESYGFKLKPESEPTLVMVWNRSDLFNDNQNTENFAFKLKFYNAEQIVNFPNGNVIIDIDLAQVTQQVKDILDEHSIDVNRLGYNYSINENSSFKEAPNDVLLVSKQNLPNHLLYYSSKSAETRQGAELVALAALILCIEHFNETHDDYESNFIAHILGQSLINHLPQSENKKNYPGSEYLKAKLNDTSLDMDHLIPDWIHGNNLFLDGLRELNSSIPFDIYTMLKSGALPESSEIKAMLQSKMEQILTSGQLDLMLQSMASDNTHQQKVLSYFERFLKILRSSFGDDQKLIDEVLEEKEPAIQYIFTQFMNKKETFAPDLSKEAYFSTVANNLATNLSNRLVKLNVFESDWMATIAAEQKKISDLKTQSEQINRTNKLKEVNAEIEQFIESSLYLAEFDYEKLREQFQKLKSKLDV